MTFSIIYKRVIKVVGVDFLDLMEKQSTISSPSYLQVAEQS
jgi:hypothetical protein